MNAQDPGYNAFRVAAEQMLRSDAPACFTPAPSAITVLARELQDLSDRLDTSGYNGDINNAIVVMYRRIGGMSHLRSYVAFLLTQVHGVNA